MELAEYTEQLMERSKARKEYLSKKVAEAKKRRTVQSDGSQVHDPNSEDNDDSPKRQCLDSNYALDPYNEAASSSSESNYDNKENEFEDSDDVPVIPLGRKGLAALQRKRPVSYEDADMESCTDSQGSPEAKVNTYSSGKSIRSRFAALADHIRNWEDDQSNYTHATNSTPSTKSENFPSNSNFPLPNSQTVNSKTSKRVTFDPISTIGGGSITETFSKTGDELKGKQNDKAQKKICVWDQAILATLESQGFVKSPSKAKLMYEFSKSKAPSLDSESDSDKVDMDCHQDLDSSVDEEIAAEDTANKNAAVERVEEKKVPVSQPKSPVKPFPVNKNVKAVSQTESAADLNTSFDPVQLPLSARKALFENAFSSSAPRSSDHSIEPNLSVAQRAAMFEKATRTSGQVNLPKKIHKEPLKSASTVMPGTKVNPVVPKCNSDPQTPSSSIHAANVGNSKPSSPAKCLSSDNILSPPKSVGVHTRLVHQQLVENSTSDWRKKDIVAKACSERKNEISALLNHWEKVSSSSADADPGVECYKKSSSSESEKYEAVFREEDESYSEEEEDEAIEDEKEEKEASGSNSSLGESESAESGTMSGSYDVCGRGEAKSSNSESTGHRSICSEATAVCNEMDIVLDSVMDPDCAIMPPPPLHTPTSIFISKSPSGSYEATSSRSSGSASGSASSQSHLSETDYRTPTLRVNDEPCEEEKDAPLLHTVSFYRRQKQEKRATPVRTIVRRPEVASPPSPEVDISKQVHERIKALQEEISIQQTVISQTSQALNLCHATEEFFGSTEQVEGERLLLIATQKRMACLNEIQRLKSHGLKDQQDGTGTLILNDLKLPLKRDFITSHLDGKSGDAVHYFLCIVRYGHQVIVTQMLSAQECVKSGSLCFTNHITLHNLPPDFSVAFEVYALQTKKEMMPHDRKYHIKRDHSKIRLTPKGRKSDSKLLSPAISSPGGPNAVRTPSFAVVGFTRFTLQNCNREICTLEKVPFSSPLEGVLQLKMQLHAEHNTVEKGFLTMFDDVSGFGAWHRRWGVLDGKDMAFWKYPDDEKKKEPILVIDLKQCITREVKLVPRDICARPHTFELVTVRPQSKGDKNTLISRSVNTLTTTKYLLSADTKEERILWCKRLNDALMNTRKWDPTALRPIDRKEDR